MAIEGVHGVTAKGQRDIPSRQKVGVVSQPHRKHYGWGSRAAHPISSAWGSLQPCTKVNKLPPGLDPLPKSLSQES